MNDSGQVRDIARSKCPIRNTNIALKIDEDSVSSDNICIGMIDKGQKNAICKNCWSRPWNNEVMCKIGMLCMGQKEKLKLWTCPPPFMQGFSQDFRIGCTKICVWGELGVQFLFIPLHLTQKIWILGCPKSAIGCPKDTQTPRPSG